MGLEHSRMDILPSNIDEEYELYKSNWTSKNISNQHVNSYKNLIATLGNETLNDASCILSKYLISNIEWIKEINILEPFAGNGVASKIFYENINYYIDKTNKKINFKMKSTDIQDLTEFINQNTCTVEFNLNSVETIEKYGNEYNILLMISPPPNSDYKGYGDYFAIKKWTELKDKKLIVFIGELGASDGSIGMYNYMLNNNNWIIDERKMIKKGIDRFGGPIEKEIFIFKNKNL